MHQLIAPAAALVTAFFVAPVSNPNTPVRGSSELVLEAGTHEIVTVIEKVARTLGRNYVFSETDFSTKPTVTLQSQLALEHDEIEPTFERLLYAKGFAIVPLDPKHGIREIIAIGGARRNEIGARAVWMTPEAVLADPERFDAVSTTVRLNHANANLVFNSLRPFLAAQGQSAVTIGAFSDVSLGVSGPRSQVAAALRLISTSDEATGQARGQSRIDELWEKVQRMEQQKR